MNVAISVDWDYFFQEDCMWDWGHREAEFFKQDLWSIRLLSRPELITNYTPSEEYKTFWKKLGKFHLIPQVAYVTDSHTFAYETFMMLGKLDVLINFDTHDDMTELRKNVENPPEYITCENWLIELMRYRRDLEVIWIQPDYYRQYKNRDIANDVVPRFHHYFAKDFDKAVKQYGLKSQNVLFSHICRSGAWTPPWSDKDFEKFLRMSGIGWVPMSNHPFKLIREYQVPTKEQTEELRKFMVLSRTIKQREVIN